MYRSNVRPRLVLRPRTRTRHRRNLILTYSLLLLNFGLVFTYFYFGNTNNLQASQIQSNGSGNWNSISTWSAGRIPESNDTVTIAAGTIVTVSASTSLYTNMKVIVYGTLHLNGGRKVSLCNGMIDVMQGGVITGDNGGSMVDICSVIVWNGNMPGIGPLQIVAPVLPVELAYFKAEVTKSATVNILWETASEINCDYFSIERSNNGTDFESISTVKGSGNTSSSVRYSYIDDNPHSPVSYYRLKEVDFDGKSQTFQVISVNVKPVSEMVVYPNPVQAGQSATLTIPAYTEKTLRVSVVDMQGKKIFSQIVEKETDLDNMIHLVTGKFPAAGTYFITASGITDTHMKKIIVI